MRNKDEVLSRAYHEAAHAVFAYHDDTRVDNVTVSDNRGACYIYDADRYERYLPFSYAQSCLAGAYAAGVAAQREHPKPDQMTLSWLFAGAEQTPEGDCWCAIEGLNREVQEGDVFDSVDEAYPFLIMKLGRLVEERWGEIEGVAFVLYERWVESEEGIGRIDGDEIPQIIEHIQGENEHA